MIKGRLTAGVIVKFRHGTKDFYEEGLVILFFGLGEPYDRGYH
jgi:hypothetical protein